MRNMLSITTTRYTFHMKFYCFFHVLLVLLCIIVYMVACFVCFYSILYNMYSYCYVCSVLGILFHCVVPCIVCVYTCTVLQPPGVNPIAVNKIYHIRLHLSSDKIVAEIICVSIPYSRVLSIAYPQFYQFTRPESCLPTIKAISRRRTCESKRIFQRRELKLKERHQQQLQRLSVSQFENLLNRR